MNVVSIVTNLDEGQTVEAATVGNEGMCGLSLFLLAAASTERAVVQVKGQVLTVSDDDFMARASTPGQPVQQTMWRYTQLTITQLARNAACHRVHPVRQRAARWLLATADRMDTPRFELTQQFFAQMLNVRRATVNEAAQDLAEDGCISYTRGVITILDQPRLHAPRLQLLRISSVTPSATHYSRPLSGRSNPRGGRLVSSRRYRQSSSLSTLGDIAGCTRPTRDASPHLPILLLSPDRTTR